MKKILLEYIVSHRMLDTDFMYWLEEKSESIRDIVVQYDKLNVSFDLSEVLFKEYLKERNLTRDFMIYKEDFNQ